MTTVSYRFLRSVLNIIAVIVCIFLIYLSFNILPFSWYKSLWGFSTLLGLLFHLLLPIMIFAAIWASIERAVKPAFERNLDKKKREMSRLKRKLERRLAKASKAELPQAAFKILSVYGEEGIYRATSKSRSLTIEMNGGNSLKVCLQDEVVLECEERKNRDSYSPAALMLLADNSREYEIIETTSGSTSGGFTVREYLPGDWEEDLLSIAENASSEYEQKRLKTIDAEIHYLQKRLVK
ncbi:MAG: hypothetical protein V1799_17850 [bacterium]